MKTRLFCIFYFVILSLKLQAAAVITKEVNDFELGLQKKIEKDVRHFLGTESEFNVVVSAVKMPEKQNKEISSFDIGYLPRPFQKEIIEEGGLKLKNLSVKIFVFSEVDDSSLKFLKTLVESHTQGLSAKIEAQKIVRTLKKKENATQIEPTFMQKVLRNPFFVLKFLAVVIGMILFLISSLWLKNFLSGLTGKTFNSIKEIIQDLKPNPTRMIDRKEEIESVKAENKFYQELFSRNLSIIHKTNLEIPDCLDVCIKKEDLRDIKGLRSLLPFLGHESHVNIRYNISEELSNALLNPKDESPLSSNDFYRWVNSFTERLSVLRIKSATLYEKILSSDTMNKLKSINELDLIEAARTLNQTIIWKIVFEVLPEDRSTFYIEQLDEKEMQMIFKAENLKKSQIIEQADLLIKTCVNMDTSFNLKIDESLLKPLMTILEAKKPGEDDSYLNSLTNFSAEIIPLVQANIWTSRMIKEIPAENLKSAFLELDIDQKLDVIVGFRELYADLFIDFVQDPKLKRILVDETNNSNKITPERIKASYKTCRAFMTSLKKQHDQGSFELVEAA
jgi:hypothetical protein